MIYQNLPSDSSVTSATSALTFHDTALNLREHLFDISKLVLDFAEDNITNHQVLYRMRCDMPNVAFYVNDASYYIISLGSADNIGYHSKSAASSSPSGAMEEIKSLLLQPLPAKSRGGRRSRGHGGRCNSHRDQYCDY